MDRAHHLETKYKLRVFNKGYTVATDIIGVKESIDNLLEKTFNDSRVKENEVKAFVNALESSNIVPKLCS